MQPPSEPTSTPLKRKGGSTYNDEALGRSQGGFSTKLHIQAEGNGKPLTFILPGGQQHEASVFESLMEQGVVRRAGRGRPRLHPERIVGDKEPSSRKIRRYSRSRGIRIAIPQRENETHTGPFDRAIYRTRNRVELLIRRLKGFRRLAARYEKRAETYRATRIIAATSIWLQSLNIRPGLPFFGLQPEACSCPKRPRAASSGTTRRSEAKPR